MFIGGRGGQFPASSPGVLTPTYTLRIVDKNV